MAFTDWPHEPLPVSTFRGDNSCFFLLFFFKLLLLLTLSCKVQCRMFLFYPTIKRYSYMLEYLTSLFIINNNNNN